MIKIISGKRWEKMNQEVVDLQLDLASARQDNRIYQEQIYYLQTQISLLNKQLLKKAAQKVIKPKKENKEQPKKKGRKSNAAKEK